MSANEIKQVFQVGDRTFNSKAEANNFIRRPKIEAAFKKFTNGNTDLVNWLIENQESVEMAFEVGTIRRVTKSEHKQLTKAVEALKTLTDNKAIKFLVENADAITDSFRWPSVKRMTDEEKSSAARNTLVAASEGNEQLADYVIANKAAILEGYNAGVEKRVPPAGAQNALAEYRAKKAAEKAAAEAAKSAEGAPAEGETAAA